MLLAVHYSRSLSFHEKMCVHYERALNKMRSGFGSDAGSSSVVVTWVFVAFIIEVFKSVFIATCAVEAC